MPDPSTIFGYGLAAFVLIWLGAIAFLALRAFALWLFVPEEPGTAQLQPGPTATAYYKLQLHLFTLYRPDGWKPDIAERLEAVKEQITGMERQCPVLRKIRYGMGIYSLD
jgi:hypothetical protein